MYTKIIESPIGNIRIISDNDFILEIEYTNEPILNPKFEPTILKDAYKQLNLYFLGKLTTFNLNTKIEGSDFQKKAWVELSKIPYGSTISYKQQAQNIGNIKAFRAVANANGKNKISIVFPCHRVVYENGLIGGYTGGVDKKIYLLNLEKNNKRGF